MHITVWIFEQFLLVNTNSHFEMRSMEPKDVADTVADIRRYWGLNHDYTDEELFANAQRQWGNWRGSSDAARSLILQVVGCGLEEELLFWLLQPHAADAADDIQILVAVCMNPYFTANGLELLKPMLDTLLLAAGVRAATGDRNAQNRKQRLKGVLDMMEGRAFTKSKAKSVLSALCNSEVKEDGVGAWMRFLELPHVLDSRVFNSRSGRDLMDAVEPIISLQQAELAVVRGSTNVVLLDGDKQEQSVDVLWNLTTQIVPLIAGSSDEAKANPTALNCSVSLVSSSDVEEYLKAKASVLLPCASDHERGFDDDDVELSAIEQLVNVWSSANEESLISRDMLDSVFDELSALKSLDILSIQASFLLGMQNRVNRRFVDHSEEAKDEFERRVRTVFNRLTGKAQDFENVESLVVLAAFCPGQVIQHCIRGARTDMLHHSLYLAVLCAAPLLLDWNEKADDKVDTLLMRELRQTLLDISSNQSSFDRESQNVLSFLLTLVGINGSSPSKRDASVITVTELLDGVINLVCCGPEQSMEMQLNLLILMQQLFQLIVLAKDELDIDPAVLGATFNLVFECICSPNASDLRLAILIREKLLLLLKNIMELMSDPVSMITFDAVNISLNSSLWTLISLFNSDFGDDELCNGLNDVAGVEACMQEKSVNEAVADLPVPNVISALQVLLWGLLWGSMVSESMSLEATTAETWRLMDSIAGFEFPDSSGKAIKGSLLIQSAIAEMMLECGSTLFRALLRNVVPYLLDYESSEISENDRVMIPQWAADKLSEQPGSEQKFRCQLVSTHSLMRYVAKCWSLSGAANIQLAGRSNVLLVGSLSHVLTAFDQAIMSSQRSLSGTLFCIQSLCFLVSTASELHLDVLSTWPTVRTQLELSLLRLLHQLEQMRGMSKDAAHFSQYFVAAWLAYLPTGQFDQVFNFIATKTSK